MAPHPVAAARDHRLPLVLVGGGGHALVVAEAAATQFDVVGFLDDHPDAVLGRSPNACLRAGTMTELDRVGDRQWILGLGNLPFRAGMIDRLTQLEHGSNAATVIHPSAMVSPTAQIGRGVFIGPRAVVNARAIVMDHAIVNTGAIVEHECVVGFNTHIAPGSVLAGRVRVGPQTLVGVGARVLPDLSIGEGCVIGAGTVVIRSVLDGKMVVGVPGRER